MNQNYADVSAQGNIQTSAGDMTVHEAQKSSADVITEAIALPLAKLFGDFAVEAVTGKLYPQTQELKANLRMQNLAEHMRKVQELSDTQQVQQRPPTVEQVELTEKWVERVQDVDPNDQPFAEFWQKWMAEINSGSYSSEHKHLLNSLESIDGFDAKLLVKIVKYNGYIAHNPLEQQRLTKLEKLFLIEPMLSILHFTSKFRFSSNWELPFYKRSLLERIIITSRKLISSALLPIERFLTPGINDGYVLTDLGKKLFSYYDASSKEH